ncbi:SCO1/SenC [Leptospira broomii serovar Hurstbridge str. 5399]|uniref:SCO1/SenC n=1 Tax=Leptospira broomii serovar Hurstbridge str. 5399 TaxID=1049789 RepID=T0GFV8_9LEPT|nr:SCO family protein [Leptospira broomii]EQA45719.1 SCO1/SenC [Leptospira broomii serovar Hurstbridge str. 5399]
MSHRHRLLRKRSKEGKGFRGLSDLNPRFVPKYLFRLTAILAIAIPFSAILSFDTEKQIAPHVVPPELQGVGVVEKLGDSIDKNLVFVNEDGKEVKIGSYLEDGKPLLLTLIYYRCPTLCNFHLNGISDVLKQLNWQVGKEFKYVAVSFDPKEKPEIAKPKKAAYIKDYGRGDGTGWSFLTGKDPEIKALASSLGFSYKWNPETDQWVHESVAYIITPDGKISRYLKGITFDERTLRLSLVEASNGKIGDLSDRIALFCFQFDPSKNRYTLYAYNIMRIGAFITMIVLAAFLFLFWKKQNSTINT